MTTWITVCDTCKRDGWDAETAGQTDGEVFADLIEKASEGRKAIAVRRHSCLMGCNRACNIAIQSKGKLAYTLGEFDPTPEAAEAVVEYASLHAEMETGVVPYRQWPQPIKGHFVTRHPPLPDK
ncbi:DUF1636 family protein [Litoreibacter roseus]|uniref:Metal-binding protein n=1 Tax=Litoreibacter roseus TaxID=2601869 RepID=A0A6N6JII6_9RHOB|nr:DUF1636 domain-containing protein [Litoreibacter roseus]GFE65012.1 hypothetical protein KIN_20860 [Litoreibacter roseus]